MEAMIGWHFSSADETLSYGDGRGIIVGQTHSVEPPIELCRQGLHASTDILDALSYAPGHILFRVALSGQIIVGSDKAVATHRRYLARLDCTSLLDQFSRACALSVAHLWNPAEDVIHFLLGDESKRDAARYARDARDAARYARDARDAARDAIYARDARDAARDAIYARYSASYAKDAASYASYAIYARYARYARYAASYARDAASYARDADSYARDAARKEQSEVLTEYVLEAMGQGEKT